MKQNAILHQMQQQPIHIKMPRSPLSFNSEQLTRKFQLQHAHRQYAQSESVNKFVEEEEL